MMMIASNNTFNSVTHEHMMERLSSTSVDALRKQLLQAVSFVGAARWVNDINRLELNFHEMNVTKFFTLAISNKNDFVEELNRRSKTKTREIALIEIEEQHKTTDNYFQLCQGHDCCNLLAHLSSKTKRPNREDIESALRIAYNYEDFQQTQLYSKLLEFEKEFNLNFFSNPYNRKG